MKALTCEEVLMATMAAADGESSSLSPEETAMHLSACVNCREEVARMQRVSELFRQATRVEDTVDLWPTIDTRLDQARSPMSWQPFAVVGVLLLVYKLIEMLPKANPGWAIKLVPLIIFGALLVFLKENPFRINTDLAMEK
jgi:anti-sigma factor RsiW